MRQVGGKEDKRRENTWEGDFFFFWRASFFIGEDCIAGLD
jgi:hypothetical protein